MSRDKVIENCRNNYEDFYTQLLTTGCPDKEAAEKCAHRFLDGKPSIKGITQSKRSAAFWACDFWQNADVQYKRG